MADINHQVTFDGSTDASRDPLNAPVEWFGRYMDHYAIYNSNPSDFLKSSVSLSGSNWDVTYMGFGGAGGNMVTLNDTSAGDTRIDLLDLSQNSSVSLGQTQVRFILGRDGDHNISLGAKNTHGVRLWGDELSVATNSGFVASIDMVGRISSVSANGSISRLDVTGEEKTNVTIENGGSIQSLRMRSGENSHLLVKDGGNLSYAHLYGPDSTQSITIEDGGYVRVVTSNGGPLEISAEGSGRLRTLEAFEGPLTLTTEDRYMSSILNYDGAMDVTIGSGGLGWLRYGSGGMQSHVVKASGHLETIRGDGNDTMRLTLGEGGAGYVRLGEGRDVIRTGDGDVEVIKTRGGDDKITTGPGYVGEIHTGDGKDVVNLRGETGAVRLGAGNDIFSGGSADDFVVGGAGRDVMKGNGGNDIFVFYEGSGTDRIKGFAEGQDLMMMDGLENGFDDLVIRKVSKHKYIEYGDDTIILIRKGNVDIDIDDFVFV